MVASDRTSRIAVPGMGAATDLFARAPRHEGDRLAAEVCRRIMMPPEKVRAVDWAGRHVVVQQGENAGSPYDPSLTPYTTFFFDLATDPRVQEITAPWATQLSKTETAIATELFWSGHESRPVGHVLPTIDRVRSESKKRIIPAARACPPVAEQMSGKEEDANASRLSLVGGGFVEFYSSGASSLMRGKSIPRFVFDEVDAPGFDLSIVGEARNRQKAWSPGEMKSLYISSPGDEGTGSDHIAARAGSVFDFFVPCPHCGTYQVLAFDRGEYGLKWESTDDPDRRIDLAEETAHYRCRSAECRQTGPAMGRIENDHKRWMLAMGVWAQKGEAIDSDGSVLGTRTLSRAEIWNRSLARLTFDQLRAEDGDEILEGVDRLGVRIVGGPGLSSRVVLRLSSLYSPFAGASFGEMAKEFVQEGRLTRDFCINWLGEPWRQPGRRIEADQLRHLLTPSDRPAGYELGFARPDCLVLTLVADVQHDRVVIDVRGWSEFAREAPLLWTGTIPTAMGAQLVEVDCVADWAFPVWGDPKRPPMRIRSFAFDSGEGKRTDEVYALVRRLRRRIGAGRFAHAVFGSSSPMTALAEVSEIEKVKRRGRGTVQLGRAIPAIRVNTPMVKSMVYGSLGLEVGDADSIGQGDGRRFPFPAPWDSQKRDPHLGPSARRMSVDEHLNQIAGEEYVVVRTREGAAPKAQWRVRRGHENHALDCLVYQNALAERHGFAHKLRAPRPDAGGRTTSPGAPGADRSRRTLPEHPGRLLREG